MGLNKVVNFGRREHNQPEKSAQLRTVNAVRAVTNVTIRKAITNSRLN